MTTPTISLIDVSTYLPLERGARDSARAAPRHVPRVRKPVRPRHPGQPRLRHQGRSGQAGDVVMMAGFAHAGDFAGAAAVRWGGRPK
jgi:hypothetical protein